MGRVRGVMLALAIGMAVVALGVVIGVLADRPTSIARLVAQWPVLAVQALLVAVPFLALALARMTARTPWVTGIALTLGIWCYSWVYLYVLADPDDGAPIGLGLLLIASPLIITLVCVAMAFARPRRNDPAKES